MYIVAHWNVDFFAETWVGYWYADIHVFYVGYGQNWLLVCNQSYRRTVNQKCNLKTTSSKGLLICVRGGTRGM